jgi:hypothetical protein
MASPKSNCPPPSLKSPRSEGKRNRIRFRSGRCSRYVRIAGDINGDASSKIALPAAQVSGVIQYGVDDQRVAWMIVVSDPKANDIFSLFLLLDQKRTVHRCLPTVDFLVAHRLGIGQFPDFRLNQEVSLIVQS